MVIKVDVLNYIITIMRNIRVEDIVDIAFVSFLVYLIIKFIRDTRAAQFIKGLLVVVLLWAFARAFKISASFYILNGFLRNGIFVMLILFQPELRSILERVGRKGFTAFTAFGPYEDRRQREVRALQNISEIVDATANLAITKTGALIVLERETKLGDIVKKGTIINANISSPLIMNIFYPKSPLHDGALIIRDNRLISAGCILPLSSSQIDLGTRHHAAIGVSEISDCFVIVVSEETGIISVAFEGKLDRRITPDALTALLKKYLLNTDDNVKGRKGKFFSFLRMKKSAQNPEEKTSQEDTDK